MSNHAEVAVVPMRQDEAQKAVETIKGNLDSAGRLALELRRREGWKALGYKSWGSCAYGEFGQSQRRLQELMATEGVKELITRNSAYSSIDDVSEHVLHPLAEFRKEPERLQEAWELANERTNGKPTGSDVQLAVDAVLERHGQTIPGQTSFLDEEEEEPDADPEETADLAAQAWLKSFNDNLRFFISVKRQGGAAQLTREWPRSRKASFVAAVEEFISLASSIVAELKERP